MPPRFYCDIWPKGELLRSGPVGAMLRERISTALLSAMQKGTSCGRLTLVLDAEIDISAQQTQLLKSQLQERTSSQ